MSQEKPKKFPGIAPPDVVIRWTRREYISIDFQTKEDIRELINLMFDKPECEFHYFKEVNSPLNPLLYRAEKEGDILMSKYEDYFYQRPNNERSFVNISPSTARRLGERVDDIVKGARFLRVTLKLSERKRRQLEIEQIVNTGRDHDTNPLELKPNFFGFGIDLTKGYHWLKARFKKKK